jgi:ferredoxin-NADP reductase
MIDVTVTAKDAVADDVVALTLAGPALPPWTPGAHVDVELRPELVRQYSLCGPQGGRRGGSRYCGSLPAGVGPRTCTTR